MGVQKKKIVGFGVVFFFGLIVFFLFFSQKNSDYTSLEGIPGKESSSSSFSIASSTAVSKQELNLEQTNQPVQQYKQIHFSEVSSIYNFVAEIPDTWDVEYIPEVESINIFVANASGSPLEHSQLFIRNFRANRFLTLQTVTIFTQKEKTIAGRPAVEYDIEKKSGVAQFAGQPEWRSERHIVTDIRETDQNPSRFFVFGQNPEVPQEVVEHVFDSLQFSYQEVSVSEQSTDFVQPIDRFVERVSKKPFGIFIEPETSPVQPEVFRGYHTAADAEIFPGEENEDVEFFAFCSGPVEQKRSIDGYGGVLVQECQYENKPIQVIYGHLRLRSVSVQVGENLTAGQRLGVLGTGFSSETSGERKHLHLGVYPGQSIDLRGYVQNQSELEHWIDPMALLQ